MIRLFKLQFVGPLVLFVAALSAEVAARALDYAPTSAGLWYLNLRVFGVFQRSQEALAGYIDIAGFQLFGIALPIFLLACLGLATRSKLPLAVSTQFAAGYAAFLLLSCQSPASAAAQASLRVIVVPTGEGFTCCSEFWGPRCCRALFRTSSTCAVRKLTLPDNRLRQFPSEPEFPIHDRWHREYPDRQQLLHTTSLAFLATR